MITITRPNRTYEQEFAAQAELDKSRILDALAVAYLKQQTEVSLVGIDDADVLSVIRQLSSPTAGSLVLQRSFGLAVLFLSGKTFFLKAHRGERDRMLFTPKQRRVIERKVEFPSTVCFTGQLSPLFVLVPNIPISPRKTRST